MEIIPMQPDQWERNRQRRERKSWRNATVEWANSTAARILAEPSASPAMRKTADVRRDQIKSAANKYVETDCDEDRDATRLPIGHLVDMLEELAEGRGDII